MIGSGPRRQRGIAALTAILVVTIATVLAVNLLWQTSVDVQRTETLLLQDQARQYDLGGEELAKVALTQDARDDGPDGVDANSEDWHTLIIRQFEAGTFEGQLEDQQGRFDLNSLVDPGTRQAFTVRSDQFVRLLMLLPLETPLDSSKAAALADATVDWIDGDTEPSVTGAEDGVYSNKEPPYVTANFWFVSPSELLAVQGYTAEIYAALAPLVTALPPQSNGQPRSLNINTASPFVIASLAKDPSAGAIDPDAEPLEYQTKTDFVDDFRLTYGADSLSTELEALLDLKSNWFLLTVTTSIGSTRSTMYSLLERNDQVVTTRLRTFDAR